jgi:hypothetical protein
MPSDDKCKHAYIDYMVETDSAKQDASWFHRLAHVLQSDRSQHNTINNNTFIRIDRNELHPLTIL